MNFFSLVDVHSALEKLRGVLNSKEKAPKAVLMIKELIEHRNSYLQPLHILDVLFFFFIFFRNTSGERKKNKKHLKNRKIKSKSSTIV